MALPHWKVTRVTVRSSETHSSTMNEAKLSQYATENELCTLPVSHSQGIQAHNCIEISPTEDQSVIKRQYYDVEHGGKCHGSLHPSFDRLSFLLSLLFFHSPQSLSSELSSQSLSWSQTPAVRNAVQVVTAVLALCARTRGCGCIRSVSIRHT